MAFCVEVVETYGCVLVRAISRLRPLLLVNLWCLPRLLLLLLDCFFGCGHGFLGFQGSAHAFGVVGSPRQICRQRGGVVCWNAQARSGAAMEFIRLQ